ncbi:hypothetical protein LCGC14_1843090, partial [marine sediment metagenome]
MSAAEKSNGQVLSGPEYNDVLIHRKKFSDATKRTDDSGAWVDSGTSFTLTAPVNALIIGLRFKARFTTNGAQVISANLKLT